MQKRNFLSVLVLSMCVVLGFANLSIAVDYGGTFLTYKNVPVKSNGIYAGTVSGLWQCPEYVKRFYKEAMGVNLYFAIGVGRNYYLKYDDSSYAYIKNSGLVCYTNNETTVAPRAGDIIVYNNDNGTGHVGVVRSSTDINVDTVEQNWSQYSGQYTLFADSTTNYNIAKRGTSYPILGWLHMPVGEFESGWHFDYDYGTSGGDYNLQSRPFTISYQNNGGRATFGLPFNKVHQFPDGLNYVCTSNPYSPYCSMRKAWIQDFQLNGNYFILVVNEYAYNEEKHNLGVVYPVGGQIRNYWLAHYWDLGYPVTNEYYSSPGEGVLESGRYVVQWFERLDEDFVGVIHDIETNQTWHEPAITSSFTMHYVSKSQEQNSTYNYYEGVGGGTEPPPVDPPTNPNYDFIRSATCEYVTPNNGQYTEPVEKDVFDISEGTANVFLELDNVVNIPGLNFRYDCYTPSGTLWNTWTEEIGYVETSWYVYRNVDISTVTEAGQWHVDVYIDDVLTASEYFTVTIPPPPPQFMFNGSILSETWTYGSPDYWDLQAVNPRNEFSVGDSVCALSKLQEVKIDHRWKTEFFINNSLVWTDESPWQYVGDGWDYSSATPILTNVQAGSGEVKVWLDTGSGYELLDQKYFTVVDNSAPFVYAGSQICEGWKHPTTDLIASNYWDLQAVNPDNEYREGDRVYILSQAEDVSVNHEWKMEVYYNGVYQWDYVSG